MKVYEPQDVPKLVDRDIWIIDGPIVALKTPWGSVDFPTRTVVVRLADGGLWVWSPVAMSGEIRTHVEALGSVRHIVSPNKIHYSHVAAWKAVYPEAVAWASPGVRERAASHHIDVTFDRDLGEAPDEAWATEIDQLVFHGSRLMDEVVFFHRASRTLILADLIENFEPTKLTTARARAHAHRRRLRPGRQGLERLPRDVPRPAPRRARRRAAAHGLEPGADPHRARATLRQERGRRAPPRVSLARRGRRARSVEPGVASRRCHALNPARPVDCTARPE